jgi:PIN domain nuclease of toxin-antitoxin system
MTQPSRILLDTCAIIWAISEPEKLSKNARFALAQPDAEVWCSPLSCAEVAWAVQRKRISIDRHWKLWFRHYVDLNDWQCMPIDLDIVEEAYSLPDPFHADPVDRILVATARLHDLHLVTGDQKLILYPHVRTLW